MFDYAYNNNYTIDEEKKQDTNEKNCQKICSLKICTC
jgi:hypothetical protein